MHTKTKKERKHLPGITVVHDMPDYSKDPYFVEKNDRARAFFAKHGLPKDLDKSKKTK